MPSTDQLPSGPQLSRRTTLAAAPLLALAAACRISKDDLLDRAPAEPEGDALLVDQAADAIVAAAALIRTTTTQRPAMARSLTPIAAMHRAHLKLLKVDPDRSETAASSAGSSPPLASRAVLVRRIVRTEEDLQLTLAGLSGRARSGSFARALASMSAAVAQQLAVLTTPSSVEPEREKSA